MNPRNRSLLAVLLTWFALTFTGCSEGKPPWAESQKAIVAWHAEQAQEGATPVLRVVYFHGNDMEPLAGYQERLTRVMDDVSSFYQDGMRAHGFDCDGIPLEKTQDGQLILHVVKGQHEAAHYDYESGVETEAEMRKALAGKIDFDREFVLALYGQCWKMEDGRYGFYSPYYGKGGSNQGWGFCHAADCHLLDPKLLTDTKNRFKYWEHYGDRDQTVAKFNSFYIGGIAHELGHGLGLPHDGETQVQRFKKGRSLMGNGNLTYREELWKPKSKGSFLSLASAVRLVSHPLFTGSHAGRFDNATAAITTVVATVNAKDKDIISLTGKVGSKIPSYAVIAYVDPEGGGDYNAKTFVAPTNEAGEFTLPKVLIPREKTEIRLFACFNNGATIRLRTPVERSQLARTIDVDALFDVSTARLLAAAERAVAEGRADAANLVQRGKKQLKNEDQQRRLALLEKWLRPPTEPVDLSSTEGATCFLSDAKWEKAETGWAGTTRDRWGADPRYGQGLFLDIAGKLHEKGLPAHCPAEHVFATAGKWDRFQATVGLRDGTAGSARAIFIVSGDGKELYRSEQLAPGQTEDIDIDISGVKSLQLVTESGQESTHTCWAVWGSPKVRKEN